jgi:hypothetical protein
METFYLLIPTALIFWFLGSRDYKHWLKFQKEVIRDTLKREESLIEKVKELQSEIITIKAQK